MKIQQKLEIIYDGMGTSVILDGKDLMGVKRVSFDARGSKEPPTLTLEIDTKAFERRDKPAYLK
jgi:hypothetical protein